MTEKKKKVICKHFWQPFHFEKPILIKEDVYLGSSLFLVCAHCKKTDVITK